MLVNVSIWGKNELEERLTALEIFLEGVRRVRRGGGRGAGGLGRA